MEEADHDDTHKVALLVEASLQRPHYGVLGEGSGQVDQVLHVLGQGVGRLLKPLLTAREAEAEGQRLHTLAGIGVLRLRDERQLLAVRMAEGVLTDASIGGTQVSGVGGAHGQRVGIGVGVGSDVRLGVGMGTEPHDVSQAAPVGQRPGGRATSAGALLM